MKVFETVRYLYLSRKVHMNCGIIYNSTAYIQIAFYVKQYFGDFKTAFTNYIDQLKNHTNGTLNKTPKCISEYKFLHN
jgi:hypothetical protein